MFEWKWDGWRCCLAVAPDGTTRLTSRNGNDLTSYFPELAGTLHDALAGQAGVFDGEIVALNEHARPEFGRLRRCRTSTGTARLAQTVPAHFFAFDQLQLGGDSLLAAPYPQRRAQLDDLPLAPGGRVMVPPSYADVDPDDMLKGRRRRTTRGDRRGNTPPPPPLPGLCTVCCPPSRGRPCTTDRRYTSMARTGQEEFHDPEIRVTDSAPRRCRESARRLESFGAPGTRTGRISKTRSRTAAGVAAKTTDDPPTECIRRSRNTSTRGPLVRPGAPHPRSRIENVLMIVLP
ncbi:hypothetical protein L3Q67_31900 [Saccharothrix sp. AJ9571]|nr:hypothetical protein L3Q67_31900 [Saccharothrix sp. AJ9571]